MNTLTRFTAISTALAASSIALAQNPQMGGTMKHIMVRLADPATLEVHVDDSVPTPILMNYGHTYAGAASVLNGLVYNAQYGWMIEGFWAPPAGSFLWIEQIAATPGLGAYGGGTMMNQGTFAPIFGTDGSSPRIQWGGTMLHNWYAVKLPGEYAATYRVYLGDASGVPTPGYSGGEVTLNWTISAPGACCNPSSGTCVIAIASMCSALGGDFQGVDTACAVNPCHAAPVCRADFNDSGSVTVQDIYDFLSAWSASCP